MLLEESPSSINATCVKTDPTKYSNRSGCNQNRVSEKIHFYSLCIPPDYAVYQKELLLLLN